VRLLAVSKGQPAQSIVEAYEAGQRDFGENYVQELVGKARELCGLAGLRWHAIGPLQRNKAKDVCRVASVVHTIDRVEIADELHKRAEHPLDVLIEVNTGGEAQKAGTTPEGVDALADHVAGLSKLRLVGLMTIPPLDAEPEANRPHFARLRELAERQRSRGHTSVVELSMGMSADFEVAIAEGATIVRVGTAVFGPRSPRSAH
jgi:pyridoxal phosphate enzyme (YggS family)